MSLSIATAMLREQFQRTLPIVLVGLVVSTVLCLLQYMVAAWEDRVSDADGSPEMVIMPIGLVIIALLYCHSDERDLKMTMPTFLLRLPVRTVDLVVWRISWGLLCVGVISIWSSGLQFLVFGAAVEAHFAFWTPFLIATTTFAVLQALAWSFGGNGILALLVGEPVFLLLAVWLGWELPTQPFDPSRYTATRVLATLAGSYLVAYAGVRIRRRDGLDISAIPTGLFSRLARHRDVDRPPFATPEEAMRWFEWRRQARMLPVLVLGGSLFLGSVALTVLGPGIGQTSWNMALAISGGWFAVTFLNALGITAALFGAYCFFQNHRLKTGPQKTLLFIRPVSTKTLATARVVVALRSSGVSLAPLVLAYVVTVLFVARVEDSTGVPAVIESSTGLGGIGVAAVLLCGALAAVWCLQWFGNVAAFLSLLGVGGAVLWVISGFDDTRLRLDPVSPPALWIGTFILFAGCAYLFYAAFRRDLVEKRSLLIALAALPFLFVGFSTLLSLDGFGDGGFLRIWAPIRSRLLARGPRTEGGRAARDRRFRRGSVFAVLPLAPLATVPLFMHLARHR